MNTNKLKVLMVSSEVMPFSKTGGLADVTGSLPKALSKNGVDIRVVMPKYKNFPAKYTKSLKSYGSGKVDIVYSSKDFDILFYSENGISYYFIEQDYYFNREGYYGYGDDGERFTFFCKAVLEMLPIINFAPDIVHSNDWQTSIINLLLRSTYYQNDLYRNIKTILTIHNIKFQGVFPKEVMSSLLGVGWEHFTHNRIEFYDQVNYLKAGINYADVVTTVSETYAEEIKHDFFGENLSGVIRNRAYHLYGIVNGIDYDEYNPATDPKIYATYDVNSLEKKQYNKSKLQEQLGLPVRNEAAVIGIITRLTSQKGLDLIGCVLNELMQQDVQIVVLGAGEYKYEEMFKYYANAFPDKVSANIKYDDHLSHMIYAGSDMFLMPSLFEPCGLSQLISMRYGTVPIVRETGGLKDTVKPYNQYTGEGNGFSFANYNAHEMLFAIENALSAFNRKNIWHALMTSGMKEDFSWNNSALRYIELYKKLVSSNEKKAL